MNMSANSLLGTSAKPIITRSTVTIQLNSLRTKAKTDRQNIKGELNLDFSSFEHLDIVQQLY